MPAIDTNILIVGFGALGQALVPLLLRHFIKGPAQLEVISADGEGTSAAQHYAVRHSQLVMGSDNFQDILHNRLRAGDWLVNLSVDVSSLALMDWCQQNRVFYVDTCVEPWAGGYSHFGEEAASNAYLRHRALALRDPGATTAVVAHGANPGLISHMLKEGLEYMANATGITSWQSWASLAERMGIKAIHIAERDTQTVPGAMLDGTPFTNTWSVKGLLSEAWQCAEMGWGSHESGLPAGGQRFRAFASSGIRLNRHGAGVRVKSWVPGVGEQVGFVISHHESLSIADLLTRRDAQGRVQYRPTVHYAYRPSPATWARLDSMEWHLLDYDTLMQHHGAGHVVRDELDGGMDQLGLLFVFDGGACWYGSSLTLSQARSLAPHNSATTLQAVAGVIGAMRWMMDNPCAGVVEAEDMDHTQVMATARPYLGEVAGYWTQWQPAEPGALEFGDFLVQSEAVA